MGRCLTGWKQYFRLAETPSIFRRLDEWIRHRLRLVQLGQWKRGPAIYRNMRRLGAPEDVAAAVASNSRRWWRKSRYMMRFALPPRYYDLQGVPRLGA